MSRLTMADRQQRVNGQGMVYQHLNVSGISHLGNVYMAEDEDKARFKAFLDSLYFPQINVRQEEIEEPHRRTFDWIFHSPERSHHKWDSFVDWLRSREAGQPYWIEGKAGSGKSTLMQFIVDHEETLNKLTEWAQPHSPCVLSFFFWEAGDLLQKNSIGLLRSLLWQLFSHDREKGKEVFKRMMFDNLGAAWTERRLLNTFRTALSNFDRHICLFLDGLDEFEKPEILLKLIDALRELQNVKLCMSSRPLQNFMLAFRNLPKLRLQDLTAADMRLYIRQEVLEHPCARQLWTASPHLKIEIKRTLLDRAQGVFLWLRLASKSLREGIENEDEDHVLRARLEELPDELEQLFVQMLTRARRNQSRYAEAAAYYFQLIIQSELSLPQFAIAIDRKLQDRLLQLESLETSNSIARKINTKMVRTWIQARCAGLLEVTVSSEKPLEPGNACQHLFLEHRKSKVHFLHKTVGEFLRKHKEGKAILSASKQSELDIVSDIYRSGLVMFAFGACVKEFTVAPSRDIVKGLESLPDTQVHSHLLRQTESVLNSLLRLGLIEAKHEWFHDSILDDFNERYPTHISLDFPLLSIHHIDILLLMARACRFAFIVEELGTRSDKDFDRRYLTELLCLAVSTFRSRFRKPNDFPFPEFLKWCLQQGVSPDDGIFDPSTLGKIFSLSLSHQVLMKIDNFMGPSPQRSGLAIEVLRLLLEHGASVKTSLIPLKDVAVINEPHWRQDIFLCEYSPLDMVSLALEDSADDSKLEVSKFLEGEGCKSSLRLRLMRIHDDEWMILSAKDSTLLRKGVSGYEIRKGFFCSGSMQRGYSSSLGAVLLRMVDPEVYASLRGRSICLRSTTEALIHLGWTTDDLKILLQCQEVLLQLRYFRTDDDRDKFHFWWPAMQIQREAVGAAKAIPSEYDDSESSEGSEIGIESSGASSWITINSDESSGRFSWADGTSPWRRYVSYYEAEGEVSSRGFIWPRLPLYYPPERRHSI